MRRDNPLLPHSESKRKMRRHRRRLRRPRLVPMCGLLPKRPRGLFASLAVKLALKSRHHIPAKPWGTKNIRWLQDKWKRTNGSFGEYGAEL